MIKQLGKTFKVDISYILVAQLTRGVSEFKVLNNYETDLTSVKNFHTRVNLKPEFLIYFIHLSCCAPVLLFKKWNDQWNTIHVPGKISTQTYLKIQQVKT